MRTRITSHQNNVTVTRTNATGETETTTYFVPASDRLGYVRVRDAAQQYPPVCEGLASMGNTLMATPATLASVIRRELRRARQAERRMQEAWSR